MPFGLSKEEYERLRSEVMTEEYEAQLEAESKARSAAFAAVAEENENGIDWTEIAEIRPTDNVVLSPAEILLLDRLNGKKLNRVSIPGYFTHEYQLNLGESVRRLFAGGYMQITEPKKKGQPPKLECTPAGLALLSEYDVIAYCSSSSFFGISIEEAYEEARKHPGKSKYAIVRGILERRARDCFSAGKFGLYRNALYGLSETYRHEGALGMQSKYLMQCCYLDAIGVDNEGHISGAFVGFAPRLVSDLKQLEAGIEAFPEDFKLAVSETYVAKAMEEPERSIRYAFIALQKEMEKVK